MEKLMQIIVLLTIAGCYNDVPLSWNINMKKNGNGLEITNEFKANIDTQFIFDKKAFSYTCYYGEDVTINDTTIISPLMFKHNQVVIENHSGERRLFSNLFLEENEKKNLPDENCMFDWFEFLSFNKKTKSIVIKISTPYLSDVKVNDNDEFIRLIYVFSPDTTQIKHGYTSFMLYSNWVALPD